MWEHWKLTIELIEWIYQENMLAKSVLEVTKAVLGKPLDLTWVVLMFWIIIVKSLEISIDLNKYPCRVPTEYKEPSADLEEQRASGVAAIEGVLHNHDTWQCLEEFKRELGWKEEGGS